MESGWKVDECMYPAMVDCSMYKHQNGYYDWIDDILSVFSTRVG